MSAAHRAVLRGPFWPRALRIHRSKVAIIKSAITEFWSPWSPLPRLLNWDFCPRYPPKLGPNVYTYMSLKSRRTTANEWILRKSIIYSNFGVTLHFLYSKAWPQRQSWMKKVLETSELQRSSLFLDLIYFHCTLLKTKFIFWHWWFWERSFNINRFFHFTKGSLLSVSSH